MFLTYNICQLYRCFTPTAKVLAEISFISSWPLWCKRRRPAMQTTQPKQATRWLKPSDVLQRFLVFFLSSFVLFLWTLFPVAASCLGEKGTSINGLFLRQFRSPRVDLWVSRFSDSRSFHTDDTSLVYVGQYNFLRHRCFGPAVVRQNIHQLWSSQSNNQRVNFIKGHKKFSENSVLYM